MSRADPDSKATRPLKLLKELEDFLGFALVSLEELSRQRFDLGGSHRCRASLHRSALRHLLLLEGRLRLLVLLLRKLCRVP